MVKDVSIIMDIPVYKSTLIKTTELLLTWIDQGKMHQQIVTANSEIIYKSKKDSKLRKILQRAALVTADGMGVVWASRILGDPVPERVTGYDLLHALLQLGNERQISTYLVGAKPEVVSAVAFEIKRLYPNVIIKGYHHGYFDSVTERELLEDIKEKQPDLLFVALGSPRQEFWINDHLTDLPVKVAIGVGGSFDILAGVIDRAPEKWQKLGLEWAYRLIREPSRVGRMAALPKFALSVWKDKFFRRH